jgi:hypothetical protein
VRLALKGMHDISYRRFAEALWGRLEQVGTPGIAATSDNYDRFHNDGIPLDLRSLTSEAFFYVFRKGYIMPVPPDRQLNTPGLIDFRATERGLQWFNGVEPFPEESVGYLKVLKELVPGLDDVIEQYIVEALTAFEREAYFATAVMIGAASEKAIYLLADSLSKALKPSARRTALKGALGGRALSVLLESVRKTIESESAGKNGAIPYSASEGASAHLASLFEAIRTQRNDAVHPIKGTVSASSVRLLLHGLPYALGTTERLRSWFDANPGSL